MDNEITNTNPDRNRANVSKDHIPGWGMDHDPKNNPTYPIKSWDGSDYDRINYERAPQQPVDREVLTSIERPSITRVFGTSVPPSGLSGMIRRFVFRFSEASAAHWMGLILADRVNAVEGVIDDFKNNHIPNVFAERGWGAKWKYNRKGFVKSIAIGLAITVVVVAVVNAKNKKSRDEDDDD